MSAMESWLGVLGALLLLAALTAQSRAIQRRESEGKQAFTAQEIAEVGISVALAAVLGMVKIFRMPQGGSVSLEMVPILYIALKRGAKVGIAAGAVLGLVQTVIDPYIVHWAQFLLDYPFAFGALGIAGIMSKRGEIAKLMGVLFGAAGRYVCHVVSGVVFFASYAPKGTNVWVYSLGYNLTYMIPDTIVALVVLGILLLGGRGIGHATRKGELSHHK